MQDLHRDELHETEPVNLPGIAARGGDVRPRRPQPPGRWHVREGGVRLQQVQLGRQPGPIYSLDRRASPSVVERIEKELAGAIDPAAPNPDRARIAGVGGPDNLVRMAGIALDDLTAEQVHRPASKSHAEMRADLAQS